MVFGGKKDYPRQYGCFSSEQDYTHVEWEIPDFFRWMPVQQRQAGLELRCICQDMRFGRLHIDKIMVIIGVITEACNSETGAVSPLFALFYLISVRKLLLGPMSILMDS